MGDDVIDLPIMRRCGLAIAVANARPQVKSMAHHEPFPLVATVPRAMPWNIFLGRKGRWRE